MMTTHTTLTDTHLVTHSHSHSITRTCRKSLVGTLWGAQCLVSWPGRGLAVRSSAGRWRRCAGGTLDLWWPGAVLFPQGSGRRAAPPTGSVPEGGKLVGYCHMCDRHTAFHSQTQKCDCRCFREVFLYTCFQCLNGRHAWSSAPEVSRGLLYLPVG